MAKTIRQQIIENVSTNLKNILKSGGYNSDCGTNVFICEMIGDAVNIPGCTITPGIEEKQDRYYKGKIFISLPITITLIDKYTANDDRETEKTNIFTMSEGLLGDIRKAMSQSITLIEDLQYVGGGVDTYPEARTGENWVFTQAQYNIIYKTIKDNPYSQ